MSTDPLDRAASPDVLHELRRAGALPVEAHREAAWWVARPLPPATWRRILDPLALVLGVALIVSGVLYLVAFNWAELGRFSKVAVGIAPVIVCGGITLGLGTRHLGGKVMATAGIPLTLGALLAIGLAYPTQGEAWPLLALWAALSVPWAVASRLDASWLGVIIAVDVALFSFHATPDLPRGALSLDLVLLSFVGVHTLAWAGFGVASLARVPGASAWVRQTLLAPTLALLAFWPLEAITVHTFESTSTWTVVDVLGILAYVVVGVVVHVGFALRRWGPFPVAVQLITLMVITTTALVRVIAEFIDQLEVLAIFLTLPVGLFVLVQLALSGVWLMWGWRRQQRAERSAQTAEAP